MLGVDHRYLWFDLVIYHDLRQELRPSQNPKAVDRRLMMWRVTLTSFSAPSVSVVSSPSIVTRPSSSTGSPGSLSPLEKPGGIVFNPFVSLASAFFLSKLSTEISSKPPGQNGTYPDLPRTKFLLGPGARSRDVEVRPVVCLDEGVYPRGDVRNQAKNRHLATDLCISNNISIKTRPNECKGRRRWRRF